MIDIDKFADSRDLFDKYYLLLRPINTDGGTADVWLALDVRTVKDKKVLKEALLLEEDYLATKGLLVAIKVYRPKNALDIEGENKFMDEFTIVYNCRHSNLITPTSFSIFQETPYLVLPYCKKGSSELLLGSMINNEDLWKYISDVSSGLSYLHRCNPPIIHQDIKPANVLIDDLGNYAITDFGISEKFESGSINEEDGDDEERSGTAAYMAPERFDPSFEPSKESDIWAFGATLYELITNTVPFGEEGGSVQPDGKASLTFPKGISTDIQRLICDCLEKKSEKRPSAEELIKAARLQKYPLRQTPVRLIAAVLAVLVLLGGIAAFLFSRNTDTNNKEQQVQLQTVVEEKVEAVETDDDAYREAMLWMSASTRDSLQTGITMMEKVANRKYVPAIYELAFTYGWFTDSKSVQRKKLLGIKLGNPHVDNEGKTLPVDDAVNEKAIGYFKDIVSLSKPEYTEINMNSAYRLGCYYLFLKKDKQRARGYFEQAKREALKCGNSEVAESSEQLIQNSK